MKKSFRFLCLFTATILTVFGVSGCMSETNIRISTDGMINYMENKYNDEFEYVDSFGGADDNTNKNIIIKSKKYPDNEISVSIFDVEGKTHITENYTQFRFKDETEKYLTSMMNTLFGSDVIVTYNISSGGTANSFTEKTSFEEFISDSASGIFFRVVVGPSFSTQDMQTVADAVRRTAEESPAIMCVEIYFASSEDLFRPCSELANYEKNQLHRVYFEKDTVNGISDFEWR